MPTRRTMAVALLGACLLATNVAAQSGFLSGHFCPAEGNLEMTFRLYETATVRLDVGAPFTGLPLRTLFDGQLAAGEHLFMFDGRDDAGQLLAPGIYLATLVGPDGIIEDIIAINCGDDLSLQSGTVIDGKEVNLPVSVNLDTYAAVDLGVYDATGTTRLGTFWQGNHSGTVTFGWTFQLEGAPLPAGDYVMRMASPNYNEDVPFSIDPYTPLQMTTMMTDASGLPVEDGETDPRAQLKGPLQELAVTFDRKLTPAEADYLTVRGLRFGGFLFDWARPAGAVVAPDSLGI
ncbi:hypothetical protein KDM41_00490, partial [bacterium]|nr:hypothetical protein [bacterium]